MKNTVQDEQVRLYYVLRIPTVFSKGNFLKDTQHFSSFILVHAALPTSRKFLSITNTWYPLCDKCIVMQFVKAWESLKRTFVSVYVFVCMYVYVYVCERVCVRMRMRVCVCVLCISES